MDWPWGRDQLIDRLLPPEGGTVLEIGCGTGRNICRAAQLYPQEKFFGVDVSDEMLNSATTMVARQALVKRMTLAQADALSFDSIHLWSQVVAKACEESGRKVKFPSSHRG